jgi:HAMP domain-containing protein
LDIAWPIFSEKAGVLRPGLSEKPYREQVKQLWIQVNAMTLGILMLALVVSLLFIKRITRPLSTLSKAAEKINAGHLEIDVPLEESRDEVGRLTSSFKRMIARINTYTQRLEDKNAELDRAQLQTRTSFTIARDIGALPNLKEVGIYLIKKLQEIVTCENMAVLVFSSNRNRCFIQSQNEFRTLLDEPVKTTVDYKSRLNREGRSANCTWYHDFKDLDPGDVPWQDVAKINPRVASGLGIKNGDTVKLTSPTGSLTCTASLWEGVRPGTIAKCYGQGQNTSGEQAQRRGRKMHLLRPQNQGGRDPILCGGLSCRRQDIWRSGQAGQRGKPDSGKI